MDNIGIYWYYLVFNGEIKFLKLSSIIDHSSDWFMNGEISQVISTIIFGILNIMDIMGLEPTMQMVISWDVYDGIDFGIYDG